MKAIERCTYKDTDLSVLITFDEENKAEAEYFINGKEVKIWKNIRPDFQTMLMAMLNQYCEDYNLIKWSY